MKVLKYLCFLAFIFSLTKVNAQKDLDDADRVRIVPFISNQVEFISPIVKNNLQSKLAQIVSRNGYSGYSGFATRFVITPNISVLTKDVIAGAPTKIALTLDLALFIGDGIDGIKYASTNLTLKGVGTNETKAYISAIKQIKPNNKYVKMLLQEGKDAIINYYYKNCDFIMGDIQKMVDSRNFDGALAMAMSVPSVSSDCYDRAVRKVKPIYKNLIDKDCEELMTKAKTAWNLGQNINAAYAAGKYLNRIDPASSCYSDVRKFVKEIGDKVKKDGDKAWDFVLKKDKDLTDFKMKQLEAFKEINVEKAKNQPKEIYRVRGWW